MTAELERKRIVRPIFVDDRLDLSFLYVRTFFTVAISSGVRTSAS